MSVSILENIRIQCLDLYNNADRDIYISNSELLCDVKFYGTKYTLAVALRACHDYTIYTRSTTTGGVGGSISSIKEGQLQVNYSTSSSDKGGDDLSQTTYGTQLKYLIKICKPAASLATTGISILGGFPTK